MCLVPLRKRFWYPGGFRPDTQPSGAGRSSFGKGAHGRGQSGWSGCLPGRPAERERDPSLFFVSGMIVGDVSRMSPIPAVCVRSCMGLRTLVTAAAGKESQRRHRSIVIAQSETASTAFV